MPFESPQQAILDLLPAGVMLCSKGGKVLYINRAGASLLGLGEEREEQLSLESLPPLIPEVGGQESGELSAGHYLLDLMFPHERRSIRCQLELAEWLGEEAYVVLFQDVTEEMRSRVKRDRDLKIESVAQLLPTLAHEIKNPLAGIQSMVEVLREEVTNLQHIEELDVILEELDRMGFLIDRMRLVDHNFWGPSLETELSGPLRKTMRLLSKRAQQFRIEFDFQLPDQLSTRFHPDMIRMILLNLVNNALDACRAGDRVAVMMGVVEQQLHLVVSDTGRGMEPDVLERAWEPFFSTKSTGSGIGLALVREVVEQFHGSLRLWSERDRGTSITVIFPLD